MKKLSLGSLCKAMMKGLGVFLIIFFFILYLTIFYSYTYDLCQMYYIRFESSLFVGISMLLIGYYLAFCILFNYIMAIFVSPGVSKKSEFHGISQHQLQSGEDSSDDEESGIVQEPNHFQTISSTRKKYRVCRTCSELKPFRAHHCSICNVCVLKMDHHCPWIDNCIGQNNHRYFLSFILYLFIATTFLASLYLNIDYNTQLYKESLILQSFVYPVSRMLTIVLSIVLLIFNSWNWYLAIKGLTAIEFWGKRSDPSISSDYSFALPTARENLNQIFGTTSYFKILLPSIRALPQDGTKWEAQEDTQNKQRGNSSRQLLAQKHQTDEEEIGFKIEQRDIEGGL